MSAPSSPSPSPEDPPPEQPPEQPPEHWGQVPELRGLRRMVIILTTTLSLGVLTIAAALVIRILNEPAPQVTPVQQIAAEQIALPRGEEIIATGTTGAALTVITRATDGQERMRIFAPDTGALIDMVEITRE